MQISLQHVLVTSSQPHTCHIKLQTVKQSMRCYIAGSMMPRAQSQIVLAPLLSHVSDDEAGKVVPQHIHIGAIARYETALLT